MIIWETKHGFKRRFVKHLCGVLQEYITAHS